MTDQTEERDDAPETPNRVSATDTATATNGVAAHDGEGDHGTASDAPPAGAKAAGASGADDAAPVLIARGNPLRWARGGITTAVGSLLAFLLMAHNGQLPFGVPLGTLFIAIATWGVMDLVGSFDDAADRVVTSTTLAALGMPIARAVVAVLLFGGTLWGGQSGWGSQWLWGALVTLTFLGGVAAIFDLGVHLGPWKTDELGEARPLWRRHGFWVVCAGALLYFPAMGVYSLWDPWETHYGEVAREILSRDDWISLWWAQDGWFFSKPILNFWIQSLAMATLRTHYQPDQMLMGIGGATAHPEWVVRAPNVLLTILAMYLLYKGVAKVFGRRAGLLGGLVLATMPDWYFLAHQTMTDMPFVAAMTAAMGLLLLGLHTGDDEKTRLYEVKAGASTFRLSGWHLTFGAILICALPQILYLASRNLELVLHGPGAHGLRPHWDEFRSGSAGNCGLPGNEACTLTHAASIPKSVGPNPDGFVNELVRTFGAFEPFLQALLWAIVLGAVLYLHWGERRLRRLYYLAAWFFAAIATMGKGPAGFALPMICAFAYVCTKKRWGELLRLEVVAGLLVILCVALPWYVAMYVRHGPPFTDRLIFHDMFNRAFHHVHDTNEGDDTSFRFYIWQLGYALFPWTGLAPLALTYWMRRSDSADRGRGDVAVFLFMWFLFAFALFSFMGTKFHHYIFPAVPPIAMLVGIVLDQMLGQVDGQATPRSIVLYLAGLLSGAMLTVAGVARFLPGSILGFKELHGDPPPASPVLGAVLTIAGLAIMVLASRAFGPHGAETPVEAVDPARRAHERRMLAAASVAAGLVILLVGRDLATQGETPDQPGAIRLLQLFTYNYRRPWPESLDFKAIIVGFVAVAIVLSAAFAVRAIRRHAVAAFGAFAFAWALWGLDVYMVKTAPHWGQHEVIEAYYANRADAGEPLVAYQMNWKGENFYTGNHVPAFVSTGSTFANWLKAQRDKGVRVMYFVTEHSRIGGLKGEVQAKAYREVTDKELNNKFVLVRAEL